MSIIKGTSNIPINQGSSGGSSGGSGSGVHLYQHNIIFNLGTNNFISCIIENENPNELTYEGIKNYLIEKNISYSSSINAEKLKVVGGFYQPASTPYLYKGIYYHNIDEKISYILSSGSGNIPTNADIKDKVIPL